MYFYALTQSYTLTLLKMDFFCGTGYIVDFLELFFAFFNAEYKGSRQRKTQIFYGLADRKGGVSPLGPDCKKM